MFVMKTGKKSNRFAQQCRILLLLLGYITLPLTIACGEVEVRNSSERTISSAYSGSLYEERCTQYYTSNTYWCDRMLQIKQQFGAWPVAYEGYVTPGYADYSQVSGQCFVETISEATRLANTAFPNVTFSQAEILTNVLVEGGNAAIKKIDRNLITEIFKQGILSQSSGNASIGTTALAPQVCATSAQHITPRRISQIAEAVTVFEQAWREKPTLQVVIESGSDSYLSEIYNNTNLNIHDALFCRLIESSSDSESLVAYINDLVYKIGYFAWDNSGPTPSLREYAMVLNPNLLHGDVCSIQQLSGFEHFGIDVLISRHEEYIPMLDRIANLASLNSSLSNKTSQTVSNLRTRIANCRDFFAAKHAKECVNFSSLPSWKQNSCKYHGKRYSGHAHDTISSEDHALLRQCRSDENEAAGTPVESLNNISLREGIIANALMYAADKSLTRDTLNDSGKPWFNDWSYSANKDTDLIYWTIVKFNTAGNYWTDNSTLIGKYHTNPDFHFTEQDILSHRLENGYRRNLYPWVGHPDHPTRSFYDASNHENAAHNASLRSATRLWLENEVGASIWATKAGN